ncbi:dTDP-4-amino-4,6-dideoxygalactose transaminase [Hymenobacter rubidus]|uniref:dTDP-4-amino-4,6-dideoxygalactose transaminase n=1 Tax=Hymenobacter rubidus TaxID=1441626 RepID=UPI00191FBB9D|nr:dTDP-4-amino-4,6-dideoxygalactose transaminase [Hymenobacter rubidus]
MKQTIPFNKPYLTGQEVQYIEQAIRSGKISGDGRFTKLCKAFLEQRLAAQKVLLTTSCTDALELSALLLDLQPDDEVIMPAFTYVGTANAFVLRGAKIVFADSTAQNPNLDVTGLERLVTPRTRAIVPVHYAGIACDMDPVLKVAHRYQLTVVEDAAQGIESFYKGQPLGTIGAVGAFSFHETKNVTAGEGGLLAVNDLQKAARAEIMRENGTNRSSFFRGEVDKYTWVDVGSSFLPSDMIAAYLWAQLEQLDAIQHRRIAIWQRYFDGLEGLSALGVGLPVVPEYATNNGHIFYVVCRSLAERSALIEHMRSLHISLAFHYLALHKSPYFANKHDGRALPWADRYTDCLVRLPLYYELGVEDQQRVVEGLLSFYGC